MGSGANYAEFRYHVRLKECRFSERIWLYGAHTRQLSVIGSALVGFDASLAQIDGNLRLIGNHVDGEVTLAGTHVGGYLQLDGTRLHNPGRIALNAPRLRVDNDFLLTAAGWILATTIAVGVARAVNRS